jgi:integrase
MAEVSRPRKEEKQPAFLSADQVVKLLEKIDTYHEEAAARPGRNPNDRWLKGLIRLAVSTGLRRNELLALRWRDVDLESEMLLVRNREDGSFKTKSGKERMVPLAGDAVLLLSEMKESDRPSPGDSVFTDDDGGNIRPDRVSKRFKRYVRQAGLSGAERISFHTLRHTCASWLAMKGTPLRVIQGILGHSSVNVTERYSHLRPEIASKAMRDAFTGVNFGK